MMDLCQIYCSTKPKSIVFLPDVTPAKKTDTNLMHLFTYTWKYK